MRKMLVLVTILTLPLACGAPDEEPMESVGGAGGEPPAAAAEESRGPEAEAVAQLNEMCPENWCAGEIQYEFLTLDCEGEECVLRFRAEREGEELEDSVRFVYDDPLIDEFGDLDVSYFERVTDALLEEWEPAQQTG